MATNLLPTFTSGEWENEGVTITSSSDYDITFTASSWTGMLYNIPSDWHGQNIIVGCESISGGGIYIQDSSYNDLFDPITSGGEYTYTIPSTAKFFYIVSSSNATISVTGIYAYLEGDTGGGSTGETVTATLRPTSATGTSWSSTANAYDDSTSTSATVSITSSTYSNRTLTLNFSTLDIPEDATLKKATLTVIAAQSTSQGNRRITVYADINGDSSSRVINQQLTSTSATTMTADVLSYITDLSSLKITGYMTSSNTQTFSIYDVRIDITYTLPPEPVDLTNLGLDKTNLDLKTDASATLNCILTPEDANTYELIWSKDNNNVEITADGLSCMVEAVSAGSSIITVTDTLTGLSATCNVTITAESTTEQIPIQSIQLDKTELNLEVGMAKEINAIINPSNANEKLVWSVNNENVSLTVNDSAPEDTLIIYGQEITQITLENCTISKTLDSFTITSYSTSNAVVSFNVFNLDPNETYTFSTDATPNISFEAYYGGGQYQYSPTGQDLTLQGYESYTFVFYNINGTSSNWSVNGIKLTDSSGNSNTSIYNATTATVIGVIEGTSILSCSNQDGTIVATCSIEVKYTPNEELGCRRGLFSWVYDDLLECNALARTCDILNLDEVYQCVLDIHTFTETQKDELSDAIYNLQRLTKNNVEFVYLDGNSNWYNDSTAVTARVNGIISFNNNNKNNIKINRIMLDIEPWNLGLAESEWYPSYSELMTSIYRLCKSNGLELDLVIPTWLDTSSGLFTYDDMLDFCDSFVCMNYDKNTYLTAMDEEMAAVMNKNKYVYSVAETQPPSEEWGVTENLTYHYDKIDVLYDDWREINNKYGYDKLAFAFHDFNNGIKQWSAGIDITVLTQNAYLGNIKFCNMYLGELPLLKMYVGDILVFYNINAGKVSEFSIGYTPVTNEDTALASNAVIVTSATEFTNALDNATAGQTIYVREGTYSLGEVYATLNGTEAAPITLRNYPNEKPILSNTQLQFEHSSNMVVKGLTFSNLYLSGSDAWGKALGFTGTCDNVIIENNEFTGLRVDSGVESGVQGIYLCGDMNLTSSPIANVTIRNNYLHDCMTGWSEAVMIEGNVTDCVVTNNTVDNTGNIALDAAGNFEWTGTVGDPNNQPRNIVFRQNLVMNCLSSYATSAGIYSDGAREITIEHNIIYHCQCGIELGAEEAGATVENFYVRNNLLIDNGRSLGVGGYQSISATHQNTYIYNNTIIGGAWYDDECVILMVERTSNLIMRNNILYANSGVDPYYNNYNSSTNLDYNCWCGPGITSLPDIEGSNSFMSDPLFTNYTNTLEGDYTLQSSSPCVNKGTYNETYCGENDLKGKKRVNGTIDIGCYEQ